MVKAYTRLAVIFGLAALFVATLGAQDRPLPDQETFLKETPASSASPTGQAA